MILTSSRRVAVSYDTCAPFCTRYQVHAKPASRASAERAADSTGIESSSNVGVTSGDSTGPVLDPLATALVALPGSDGEASSASNCDGCCSA